MRVLAAPDKFKGTATGGEVAAAIADGVGGDVVQLPLADGGDGTLEALGGANRTSLVTGPLGEPVEAEWRLAGHLAVIEMARASGLVLAGGAEANDPVDATTAGTGELISLAAERGARRIVIGVGGSATTDGGLGALRAMHPLGRFRGTELLVACDVLTQFVDAAEVFGPQKGATTAQVELLRRRLVSLAQGYLEEYGIDVSALPGSGAAGGLGGGLAAAGAELVGGFDLIAEELDLSEHVEACDVVVTGEGRVDATSFDGKVVGGVLALAAETSTPVIVIGGSVDSAAVERGAVDRTGVAFVSLSDRFGEDTALADPVGCITSVFADGLEKLIN